MTDAQQQHLKCRLYLYAVLPALDDLLKHSEEANALIARAPFSIALKTRTGLRAGYFFEHGQCHFVRGADVDAALIELMFHSESQLVSIFERKRVFPPIPIRGISRVGRLRTFQKLTALLECYMNSDASLLESKSLRENYVKASLGIGLRALCEICRYDDCAKEILLNGPQGIAQFQIAKDGVPTWFRLQADTLEWGHGEPPAIADVVVSFRDELIAMRALRGEMDSYAEIGLGNLEIIGLAPLAEKVDILLERVANLLIKAKYASYGRK